MYMQLTDVLDVAASLGLIMVLGYAYAKLHHQLRFPNLSQYGLGALFGLATVMEMMRPFEPMAGLIIDFRNIPIAIAGAFLGLRGAVTCLAIAVAMRLNLGGIGMWAGVLGMGLAMAGGVFWAWYTKAVEKRGLGAMVLLALVMSVHLASALVLPETAREWFYAQAALPLLVVNLIAVPLVGLILEGERIRHRDKRRLQASSVFDPDTGLRNFESFTRQCAIKSVAMDDGSYKLVLVLRLRLYPLMSAMGPAAQQKQLLAAIKMRTERVLQNVDIACCYGDRLLLIPLTLADLARREEILVDVRRTVTEAPYMLADTALQASVDLHILPMTEAADLRGALDKLTRKKVTPIKGQHAAERGQVSSNNGAPLRKSSLDTLFTKFDVLLGQNAIAQKGQ